MKTLHSIRKFLGKNKTLIRAIQSLLLLATFCWPLCLTAMAENAPPDDNLLKSGNFDESWKSAWRVQGGGEDFPQGEAALDEKVFHSPPGAVKMIQAERINYTQLDQYVNVEPGSKSVNPLSIIFQIFPIATSRGRSPLQIRFAEIEPWLIP